ncbi:MAG TPA: 4-(cytidine 5'-diphospho)-2-C-methyl-D-erythritol kinase [Actinomycetota bacterium]|nr:4-(cytidine 5'-diphospho)-2-C-methyl-D-erythritol kinase [Actinomycetota bacterium]
MDAVTVRTIRRDAHAKINLFLRVLSAREDGYHEIESLVVPISLADRVVVRPAEELRVEIAGEPAFSSGGLNLALVAALALADACAEPGGALVKIEKRIPVAGGLGGGSADAAATLLALNELWGCEVDPATLEQIGDRIGSDVPAMLSRESVLVGGRGERLAPAEVPPFHWVLVRLGFGVRSPDAYRWWDEDGAGTGPDPDALLAAATAGDAEALGPLLFNDLERPVAARHPEIAEAARGLIESGALGAIMSGSGSSVIGLARDEAHARELAAGFERAEPVVGPPADAA